MERRKELKANYSLQSHLLRIIIVTSGGPTCRSPEINNDKSTTFRRPITDLLGGVRAKPLFRDSTTIPAWNDKTETATITKQLRVAISSFTANKSTSLFRPWKCDVTQGKWLIAQAFVLCLRPGHAMLIMMIIMWYCWPRFTRQQIQNDLLLLSFRIPRAQCRRKTFFNYFQSGKPTVSDICRLQTVDHTSWSHFDEIKFQQTSVIALLLNIVMKGWNLAMFIIPAVTRLAHSVEMLDHSVSSIVKLNASFVRSFLFLRQELIFKESFKFSVSLGYWLWMVMQFCVLWIKRML